MRITPWLLLSVCFFASAASAAAPTARADAGPWTVSAATSPHGKATLNSLIIANRDITVDLGEKPAWTILHIKYHGQELVGLHGANGCVLSEHPTPEQRKEMEGMTPKQKVQYLRQQKFRGWIGTGHGGEIVRSLTITVDGKDYPYGPDLNVTGREVVITKVSNIGPLDEIAEMTFPASGDRIIERHSYKVVEDLSRRFGFLYVWMHCNDNSLTQYAVLGEGDKLTAGQALADAAKGSKRQDVKMHPVGDAQAVALYNPDRREGIAYVYGDLYKGSGNFKNSIWDHLKDNKLYFRPAIHPDDYKVGDTFQYVLAAVPFSAEPENWKETFLKIAVEARPAAGDAAEAFRKFSPAPPDGAEGK